FKVVKEKCLSHISIIGDKDVIGINTKEKASGEALLTTEQKIRRSRGGEGVARRPPAHLRLGGSWLGESINGGCFHARTHSNCGYHSLIQHGTNLKAVLIE